MNKEVSEVKSLCLDDIPSEMKATKRWVMWKLDPIYEANKIKLDKEGKPQFGKVPYDPKNNWKADSTDPSTWSSFDQAVARYAEGGFVGVGFVLGWDEVTGRNFAGVDLDHLESAEDWQRARKVAGRFDSYCEISPSEKGIHIISLGKKDGPRCKEPKKNIEIYDHARFFTVTGKVLDGKKLPVNSREEVLREFYHETFPDKVVAAAPVAAYTPSSVAKPGPAPLAPVEATPDLTDDDIIQRLMNDKNGDKFRRLYTGDTSDYASPSEADSGFAAMVRFYTRDQAQIKRIMLRSELKREKWDRKDYLDRTIAGMLEIAEKAGWTVWTPAKGRRYHPSPNGNADRFVDMFGEGVLYRIKGDKGTWLLWNKNIWKPDNTLEIENMGREIPRMLYMEAAQMDEDKRKTGGKFALKSDSIASIRAFLDAVKSDRQIARYYRDFDQNPFLVGLPGSEGIILELTEKGYRLRQARKEDMVTMACSVLPATREDKREPIEWLKFLDLIFVKTGKDGKVGPDKELIKYIQKVMGYSLLGRQDQQAFFVFYGDGSNGKSTLLRVWALILGLQDYATYPDIETFGKKLNDKEIRSDIAAIMKQRVVFVVEGDRKLKLNITLINKWTGGQEPLTFRDLYERTVSEWPQGTLVIAVNNKPTITDSNYGIWRRVRLVPFLVNLDTTLKEKKVENYADILFEKEGDLIFRWMLQGYEEYKRDGLKSPPSVDEATKQYKSESNSVFLFAGDILKVEGNGRLMSSELMEKYKEYCITEELDKIDMKEFREELEKFYDGNILVGNARTKKGIVWRGLKFKDEDDYSLDILTKENELPT